MLKFIGRQWRGEALFWVSVLLFSLILPWALIIGGTQWLSKDTIESTPQRSIVTSAVIFSVIAMVGIWQIIGTWRASSKARAPGRWFITRWMARLVALAGLAATAFVVSTVPPAMARFYSEMSDTDIIGRQAHSLTVEGDLVVITGRMSWGLFDKFTRALADNDQLQTVVLNSSGGHFGCRTADGRFDQRAGARYAHHGNVRQRLYICVSRGAPKNTAKWWEAWVSRAVREH